MFEKSVKEDLQRMKENLMSNSKYVSFLNDGYIIEDDAEYVNTSIIDNINESCSRIDYFFEEGTKTAIQLNEDFDQLDFLFKIGIIYNKKELGNNNEILETSNCQDGKARYFTGAIRVYKDSKLIKEIPTTDMSFAYQGFINYDEFIKSAKREKIQVNGPKSFSKLREQILNGQKEEIYLSINFKKVFETSKEVTVLDHDNEIINEVPSVDSKLSKEKRKILSLFK